MCNLRVICNSNRFHSFIFKLCIMIVHTLKMSTGNADPEQSLVFFNSFLASSDFRYLLITFANSLDPDLDLNCLQS